LQKWGLHVSGSNDRGLYSVHDRSKMCCNNRYCDYVRNDYNNVAIAPIITESSSKAKYKRV